MDRKQSGILYVISAYFLWGVLPVYWKQLEQVPATVTLAHRVVWSLLFLAIVMWFQGTLKSGIAALFDRKQFFSRSIAAFFVSVNWLTYVWAMGHGYVAESGLGYFICPLLIVVFAAVIFKEKMNTAQIIAIALVVLGVSIKILSVGQLPWVAVSLALSWALYCTIRKIQASDPISSLLQEVIIIAPILLAALLVLNYSQLFKWYGNVKMLLLLFSGPITAVPILLLVKGLKTVSMSKLAIIQFLTPTLNLVAALFLGEKFNLNDLYAYLPIWLGVLIFVGIHIYIFERINKFKIKFA